MFTDYVLVDNLVFMCNSCINKIRNCFLLPSSIFFIVIILFRMKYERASGGRGRRVGGEE